MLKALVDVTFIPRITGDVARVATYFDETLETGGDITINQNSYVAALDRVYPVKGRKNMHIETENTGGANGLTYTIEATSKEFRALSDLADADFSNVIKVDTNVAFGVTVVDDVIDISPQTTAIRVRVKEQVGGNPTTRQGIVSTN